MMTSLQSDLDNNSERVSTVETKLTGQEVEMKSISERLEEVKVRYGQQLAEHTKLLSDQRLELLKMTLSMFKQDATVDATILLFSWLLLRTPIFSWPLYVLSNTAAVLPVRCF